MGSQGRVLGREYADGVATSMLGAEDWDAEGRKSRELLWTMAL